MLFFWLLSMFLECSAVLFGLCSACYDMGISASRFAADHLARVATLHTTLCLFAFVFPICLPAAECASPMVPTIADRSAAGFVSVCHPSMFPASYHPTNHRDLDLA